MDGSYQLHLVPGVVGNQGKDNRSFHLSGDQNRVAFRTAEGRLLRSDLDPLAGLKGFESPEILRIRDFQIDGSRIGINGEFGQELVLDPGNLGKVRCNTNAVDDFPSDLNWMSLSFSGHFSISCFPSG